MIQIVGAETDVGKQNNGLQSNIVSKDMYEGNSIQ